MAESITLSTNQPEMESMRYEFLREEGIRHIERLSGKLWTDYNLSDPGVTMLEVLSYAITDLGYRTSYSIPDMLAQNPDEADGTLRNFYTAREILPMAPVTLTDYRKLLIDVEVITPDDVLCPAAGVKNAWLQRSANEIPVYASKHDDALSYTPENPLHPNVLNIRPLYDVLLEFGACENLGDLNENTIEQRTHLYDCGTGSGFDPNLSGVSVSVYAEFPRWDSKDMDWNDSDEIKAGIKNVVLDFGELPSGYSVLGYGLTTSKELWIDIRRNGVSVSTTCIEDQLKNLLYGTNNPESFVHLYQRKVFKVLDIVKEVRAKLMENRNLCEDFIRISALKVEEIAMCGDIVIAADADVEEVEAHIYFAVRKFLSPTVYFYTLEEMYTKGYRTEEIFEGPALDHGFIDPEELNHSDMRESIHVSDLIRIIMDIQGVEAVRNLQIANIPLDNTDGIISRSVKWCLQLAFDKNYVPRLSVNKSDLTFLKENIPYTPNQDQVDALLEELAAGDRPQKLYNIALDLPVPKGEYRDLADYESIQEEFPIVYGIGSEGLPQGVSELRKAQAKQLKGFLLFFDQLLGNYLAQLAHVGELFSMNGELDENGEFVINKTYFTQGLEAVVPDMGDLLVDGQHYVENLQHLAEDTKGFDERRNRFLNHLMARFGEQFTDYALLVYKLSGKKSDKELLEDKLNFLNHYPEISSGRFKAFNYESPCEIWHKNNVSGLEKRVALLSGINESDGVELSFPSSFEITTVSSNPDKYAYRIVFSGHELSSIVDYPTEDAAKKGIEKLIVNGVDQLNYSIVEVETGYRIGLSCSDGKLLAWSELFAALPDPVDYNVFVSDAVELFEKQYYANPESNRNNLIAPFRNYYRIGGVTADMGTNPPRYLIHYDLNYLSAGSEDNFPILRGPFIGYGECKSSAGILSVNPAGFELTVNGDLTQFVESGDTVTISDSDTNDGNYTVDAISVQEPSPGTFQTILILDNAPVLTDTLPRGVVLYSTQPASDLIETGEESVEQSLFELSERGLHRYNYTFSEYDPADPSSYSFHIIDKCGEPIGTSSRSDFNSGLASAIADPHDLQPTVTIVDSQLNDGTYTVVDAVSQGTLIAVTVDEPMPSLIADGKLVVEERGFPVSSVHKKQKCFSIDGYDLSLKLFTGDRFDIAESIENDGVYSVRNIAYNPVTNVTSIWVNEIIPDSMAALGKLNYSKRLTITRNEDNPSVIYVKGGADEFAVTQMMEFLRLKFFSHEGMHLVEHILLRPKINEEKFLPFGPDIPDLRTDLSVNGSLIFGKKLPLWGVDSANGILLLTGNHTADFTPVQKIRIRGSENGIIDGKYDLINVQFNGTETVLKLYQSLPASTSSDYGNVEFLTKVPVAAVTSPTELIINSDVNHFIPEYPVTIKNSEDAINDGKYFVDQVSGSQTEIRIEVNQRKVLIQDELMEVNLNADCTSCTTEDPYSFILTIVLPSWQGRCSNQDFRSFLDRTFRLECPAHIVPNICWIDYKQMIVFEKAYKNWLIENKKVVKDELKRSKALGKLIEVIENLRSVYPKGTLHDCEVESAAGNNMIILNRTSLGTN